MEKAAFSEIASKHVTLLALFLIFFSAGVLAQGPDPDDPVTVIMNRINEVVCSLFTLVLYVAGGIAALMIILAGVKYLAADNPVDTGKAKKMIVYAATGLVIVFIACPVVDYLVANTKIVPFQKSCSCFSGVPGGPATTTTTQGGFVTTTSGTGGGETGPVGGVDIGQIVGVFCTIINLLVFLSGIIAPVMIILAGARYMTSEDPQERDKAKQMIVGVFTGLIVVLIACPAVNYVVDGIGLAPKGSCSCFVGVPGGGATTTSTTQPVGPTTTSGASTTTQTGVPTTTTTTISPVAKYLTAKNLVDCINQKGMLQTNDKACQYCAAIEQIFNETTSPPVGPARPEYLRMKKKISPTGSPCGGIPCWVYGVAHMASCKNFKELNDFYECHLVPYGTAYMCCDGSWTC